MKYLIGEYYVEVEDHQFKNHPTEIIILRKRDPAKSLRTQYQVQNNNEMRKNQKEVYKNDNHELEIMNCTKIKKPIQQQPKFKPLNCPFCKQKKSVRI